MTLTLCQIGAHHGEELQDAEIVGSVPGWHVAEYHARCGGCGGSQPLSACWLDVCDQIHCGDCLAGAVLADQRCAGVIMMGLLHLGRKPDALLQVRSRLQQCNDCDAWFSGSAAAKCCEPCRRRGVS